MNQVMERKMHLTDQALLALSAEDKKHLLSCESCRQRYENLTQLQQKLSAHESLGLPPSLQKMSSAMLEEIDQLALTQQSNHQVKFWRHVSIGLAASLVISLSIASYFGVNYFEQQSIQVAQSQKDPEDRFIERLIQSNRELQSRLVKTDSTFKFVSSTGKQLEQKLADIDSAIQHAYLVGTSKSKKSNLWQERLDVLEMMLEQQKNKKHRSRLRI